MERIVLVLAAQAAFLVDPARPAEAAPAGNAALRVRKLLDTPLRDTSIGRGPDGTWYLTGTCEPFWAYNAGIHLWRSRDLKGWEPMGMVNVFFKDDRGRWWSTFFGSDAAAPWRERPGILPIAFGSDGRVIAEERSR